ncbi:MAG: arylesterase [Gammaproteobacteria bacterium]|nr:arylesterase [Gammaproteobacteria bacterium]
MFRVSVFIFVILNSPLVFAAKEPAGIILIIGDSISAAYGINSGAGWVSLLATKVTQQKKPYQVINASISGDTSSNGVNRTAALLQKYRPAIVIIELGGNDGLRGLSLKSMQKNLKQMIELCRQYQSKVLLAGMKIPPNYGKRYSTAFYQVYQHLAQQQNISLIPFLLDGIGDRRELMQSDGIHPTEAAQPKILENVWHTLQALL